MPSYRLKLYPRGFLGVPLGLKAERTQVLRSSSVGFGNLNIADLRSQVKPNDSHPEVDALYAEYIRSRKTTSDFEFTEKVLRLALTVFGTTTFEAWFEAQYKNPMAGDLHGRFLVDTLKFLYEGRREVSLENWGSLLNSATVSGDIGEFPQYARKFFGVGERWRESYSMTEIIQKWCQLPSGFEDLLGTLHILFGAPTV